MKTTKIVLDTNVLYSGLYSSEGASYVILEKIYDGLVIPVISTPLIFEYEEVLKRDQSILHLSDNEIDKLLDNICDLGEAQRISFLWRPYLKDPKDDHVLELAIASNTNMIVTHNIKDFRGSENFGINVIKPGQFLEKIK
ncbi:MAG: putative toxin-antitoxin system toxin component, PIN family [Candidatus Lokiarchaeota archaeon]|nr:putative toxin-antitoxin system toxin component, PIN family [Candidatus Lokiarchaeota archaeon]